MTTGGGQRVRPAVVILALWAAVASGVAVRELWLRPAVGPSEPPPAAAPAPPPAPRLGLFPATFADLPGWEDDDLAAAAAAFTVSCRALAGRPVDEPLAPAGVAGTAGDWQLACAQAAALPAGDTAAARTFFTAAFRPWKVYDTNSAVYSKPCGAQPPEDPVEGLFTGYYEPSLAGSRRRGGRFQVPLYRRPPELVAVDLGRFRDDLAGQRIAGRVEGGVLVPFPDRAGLDAGALAGRGLELAWVADPVAAFFLHIQGSGRVELAEGGTLRVGYAGQNGHPYRAIGRDLVERGELELDEVSLQSIGAWLRRHPEAAAEVMAGNRSYVFFRQLSGDGPVGSLGVPLTAGRSLAVDPTHLPLGAPLWLSGTAPAASEGEPDRRLDRLLVAQDTGGAIRGVVRGDVFWGHGAEAEAVAGRMRHPGRLWLLLPRRIEPRPPPPPATGPGGV